jgi:hypothetical protein
MPKTANAAINRYSMSSRVLFVEQDAEYEHECGDEKRQRRRVLERALHSLLKRRAPTGARSAGKEDAGRREAEPDESLKQADIDVWAAALAHHFAVACPVGHGVGPRLASSILCANTVTSCWAALLAEAPGRFERLIASAAARHVRARLAGVGQKS